MVHIDHSRYPTLLSLSAEVYSSWYWTCPTQLSWFWMLQMGELKRKAQISFKNSEISSCILQKLMRYLGLVGVPPSLYTHSFTQATFTTAALTLPRSSCNWYAEWTTIVVCRGGWRYRTPQNTRWGLTSNTDITLGTQPAVHSGVVCRKHCKHTVCTQNGTAGILGNNLQAALMRTFSIF